MFSWRIPLGSLLMTVSLYPVVFIIVAVVRMYIWGGVQR